MIEFEKVSTQANRNRRALAGVWLLVGMVVMLAVMAALRPLS